MDLPTAQQPADHLEIRLSDPGEVAAALPQLLGFHPAESLVLVGLGGPSGGRVGLTVRADLPPGGSAAPLARLLVRSLRSDEPAAALAVVVSEAPDDPGPDGDPAAGLLPHRALVHELVLALAAARIAPRDVLLVRRGRWWSYDCPHPCCAPAAGTPVPGGVSALAAAAVCAGQVVAADRAALAQRLDAPPGSGAGMRAACARAATDRSARLREVGARALAEESWAVVRQAVGRCRPGAAGQGPLDDDELAGVGWALRDVRVRDHALQLALGEDGAAAEVLWTECARRVPAPLDAAPATLLAVSAWLRGDGATAGIALDRALDADPGYTLALLLRQALDACLPPADLRDLVGRAAALTPADGPPA
ncbi:DUF4192 domain-containing protein [Blastococcus sp. MG754426]|uniref:DUF4192 domain-containing protein n=1 Tax=unclassified Blastococcus TaxID=2619396 RepID=UPI001EF0EE65|nr:MULTISPECIES: DUF4192 domain-containing protein [unclassified Blastococcus]MCF6506298.1 DUF4192 domain-containing protein [Blastococcus sp. MG754426]MCF6510886.1 DUF4192 domain-containing protein [Blastococcus sp. MG754427]MCF6733852.1 DUF4192 domain-containing protein [Blastococcus sp. KM273129]